MPDIRERIQQRLTRLQLSPRAASLASGMSSTAVRDIFRKPDNSPTMETIRKLSIGLQTTPEWLAFGSGDPVEVDQSDIRQTAATFKRALHGGIVEAGSFRPVDDFDDEAHIRDPIFDVADKEFPEATLVSFDVAGDSMNALRPAPILPGTRVIALDFDSLGNRAPVRDGMVVVIEQRLNGGLLRERSIKQVELYRDRTEYHPRSHNSRHKPIVVPHEHASDDGREVVILAIVRRITTDLAI